MLSLCGHGGGVVKVSIHVVSEKAYGGGVVRFTMD